MAFNNLNGGMIINNDFVTKSGYLFNGVTIIKTSNTNWLIRMDGLTLARRDGVVHLSSSAPISNIYHVDRSQSRSGLHEMGFLSGSRSEHSFFASSFVTRVFARGEFKDGMFIERLALVTQEGDSTTHDYMTMDECIPKRKINSTMIDGKLLSWEEYTSCYPGSTSCLPYYNGNNFMGTRISFGPQDERVISPDTLLAASWMLFAIADELDLTHYCSADIPCGFECAVRSGSCEKEKYTMLAAMEASYMEEYRLQIAYEQYARCMYEGWKALAIDAKCDCGCCTPMEED